MARTSLMIDSIFNFCSTSGLGSTRNSQICTPSWPHGYLAQLATYTFGTKVSTRAQLKPSSSSACLESLPNVSDGGRFFWHRKLLINSLCFLLLFLFTHSFFFFLPYHTACEILVPSPGIKPPCIGSSEFQPLDHQRSAHFSHLIGYFHNLWNC